MKKTYYITCIILTLVLCLTGCGGAEGPSGGGEVGSAAEMSGSSLVKTYDDDTLLSWPFSKEIDRTTDAGVSTFTEEGAIRFTNGEGRVTFESGSFEGENVRNEQEALEIAEDYAEEAGYFEGSEILYGRTDSFKGITVYTFLQQAEGIILDRGILKVITKEDGTLIGIANALLTGEEEDLSFTDGPDRVSYDLNLRFRGFETETHTAELKDSLGQPVSVSVPVVKDPETGNQYLADPQRNILCTELPDNSEEKPETMDRFDSVCLQSSKNTESKLITYSYFLRVYDYFAEKGWQGPDGRKTTCQLIFDDSGESDGNASFNGYVDGFMLFSFGVNDEASQSLQVMAHEFMHGVSSTNHIGSYKNETGALDEGISDNMGDAVESVFLNDTFATDDWFESLLRVHTNHRPLYVWDEYYLPPAGMMTTSNDSGGVHTNSSILSMLSYRLAEAGMSFPELFDFWMMFDLTLTPATGFQETAARLPFVAEAAGMPEYAPVLRQAAKELNLIDMSFPETLPSHQFLLTIRLPEDESFHQNPVTLICQREGAQYESSTYPMKGTGEIAVVLQEGDYILTLRVGEDPDMTETEEKPDYFYWNGTKWIPEEEMGDFYDYDSLSVPFEGGKKYQADFE